MNMPITSIGAVNQDRAELGRANRAVIREFSGDGDPYYAQFGFTRKGYLAALQRGIAVLDNPTRRITDHEAAALARWREPRVKKIKSNLPVSESSYRILDLIYGRPNSADQIYKKAYYANEAALDI